MARADREPHIRALRNHKGTKFLVTLRDGATKTLVLSTKANKWELLKDTLEAIPWLSVEAQNEKGEALGIVERDADFFEEDEDEGDIDSVPAMVRELVKINMASTAAAMQETRKMFADVMKAQSEVIGAMTSSISTLQETYTLAMQVQRSMIGSGGAPAEDDKVMEMVKMVMMLKMGGSPALTVQPKQPTATKPPTVPLNGAKTA